MQSLGNLGFGARPRFLKAAGTSAAILGLTGFTQRWTFAQENEQVLPPLNVVLIMTDDQGYGDITAHGCSISRTPHVDTLREQSVRFEDFHVAPFCAPTRASLMTGRMPDRTGVTRTNYERNNLPVEEVIMPEFFKASGYRTGIFGKWHLGTNYPFSPNDRGFDEWFGVGNGGLATVSDFWGNDRLHDTYWHNGNPVQRAGFCTDVYFDQAMTFIEQARKADQPFFAYIATNVPHWDWNVIKEWLEDFPNAADQLQAAFYASVARADWNLGRLRHFLRKKRLSENTLLVFLTDNGSDNPNQETANKAGMRGKKLDVYEGGHRVPCFNVRLHRSTPESGAVGRHDAALAIGH